MASPPTPTPTPTPIAVPVDKPLDPEPVGGNELVVVGVVVDVIVGAVGAVIEVGCAADVVLAGTNRFKSEDCHCT